MQRVVMGVAGTHHGTASRVRAIRRAMVCVAALCAGGLPAGARADETGRVAAWPLSVQGVPEEPAYGVQVSFRREMESLLGPRLVAAGDVENAARLPAGQQSAACLPSTRCAVALARTLDAGTLVHGVIRAEGTSVALDLVAVDARGEREAGRVSAVLPDDLSMRGAALREAVARLVVPERYKGTLVVNGWQPDLLVVLDGEPRPEFKSGGSTMRAQVRVGRHVVEIKRGKDVVLADAMDVRFEDIVVMMAPPAGKVAPRADTTPPPNPDAPPPAEKEPSMKVPVWVGPVVMALAVPPVLLGLPFLLELLHVGPLALADPSSCSRVLVNNNGSTGVNGSYDPARSCGSLWQLGAGKDVTAGPFVALDVAVVGATMMLTTVALAVGVALLVAALLPPTLE